MSFFYLLRPQTKFANGVQCSLVQCSVALSSSELHFSMIKLKTLLEKFVVLVLLSYFSLRVWQSAQKLSDDKIGLSVSEEFSEYRLFPCLSICLFMKNITREFVPENVDGNLQRLLNDVLLGFVHRNGSKNM